MLDWSPVVVHCVRFGSVVVGSCTDVDVGLAVVLALGERLTSHRSLDGGGGDMPSHRNARMVHVRLTIL